MTDKKKEQEMTEEQLKKAAGGRGSRELSEKELGEATGAGDRFGRGDQEDEKEAD